MKITSEKIIIALLAILLVVAAIGYFRVNRENKRLREDFSTKLEQERQQLKSEIEIIRSQRDSIRDVAESRDVQFDSLMNVLDAIDTSIVRREVIYIDRIKEIDESTPEENEDYWRTEFGI